jgi:SAM-dependent methyltransferase
MGELMSWNAGYVADVPYAANYSQAMSPGWITTAAIAARQIPRTIDQGFRYLDLGCGYATTLLPLAASNPHAEFVGIDFMPEHVAFAERVIQRTQLTNATVMEASFQDIVDNPARLGDPFDFIVMHGVYTWVSPQIRASILELINRHLKPGGIVYVGYNAHPGWTRSQPLQHLIYTIAQQHAGSSIDKMIAAVRFLAQMKAVDAPILKNMELPPSLKEAMEDPDRLLPWAASYLAHEYLNEHWNPIFFSNLCADMSSAKMSYVGACRMMDHVESSGWSEEQQKIIAQCHNPVLAESVKDMLMPSGFRRDLFARGRAVMPSDVRNHTMLNMKFVLVKPVKDITPEFGFRENIVKTSEVLVKALADTLTDGPKYIHEIMQMVPEDVHHTDPAGIAALLMDIGIALPVTEAHSKMQNPAQFNFEYIAESRATMTAQHIGLASPVLGAGKAFSMDKIIAYQWLVRGKPDLPDFPEEVIKTAEHWEPIFRGLEML